MQQENHAFSWAWVEPVTGRLLASYNAAQASLSTRVWNFKYNFHTGEFLGLPIKILWLLLALLPSFFSISGLYLWRKRKVKIAKKVNTVKAGNLQLMEPRAA